MVMVSVVPRRVSHPLVVLVTTALFSALLHWGIGWEATVLAGVLAGGLAPRWHGLIGGAGVALGWAGFVVYTAAVAPPAFRILLDTLGALGGNIPGEIVVGLTIFSGGVLGSLGGGIGRLLVLLGHEYGLLDAER